MTIIQRYPAREAPFPEAPASDACAPATDEDVLNVGNVQGNILAGFNKDHQVLMFLRITDAGQFRVWLAELTPFVATTEEVLAFNRLFKQLRTRRGDSKVLQVTWMNIAFSFAGLGKLAPRSVEEFRDEAFRDGMAARSTDLGDPAEGEGSTGQWLVGGEDNAADVVLIFAGDDRDDVLAEVSRIETSIFSGRTPDGRPMRCGVEIVFRQEGATLPSPLTGHEHFGFLDGVSQPGLRGRTSDDPHSVLTLRQNPADPGQGKPGQDLLWPGEFVFGYPGQDPADMNRRGENSLSSGGRRVAPEWAQDGAYLVFRRLRQDVPGFRSFLREEAARLGVTPTLLGAKVVGRYPSGAPIMLTGDLSAETPYSHRLGGDDCRNNAFEFGGVGTESGSAEEPAEGAPRLDGGGGGPGCGCPAPDEADPDPAGLVCPFAAHIRKAYPRDDRGTISPELNENTTQTHRLLRRGIPFGPPYPLDPPPDLADSGERGLLFLAYQTSIVEQFEFVQKAWANNPEFKDVSEGGALRSGFDLIIGQNGGGTREFVLPLEGRPPEVVRADATWVTPTGGGYFFSPSLQALHGLADGSIG
ncbi:MAG TPA: Dyp-type peroxidase [Longimicrobiaceae bacterium]